MHWRKSMSERAGLGGLSTDALATRGIYAPRDSVLLPPGNSSLPRSDFTQAVLDVLHLLCAFLLVSATGCGIAFAFFVLVFVRL